jgi:hypothetical protein
LGKGPLPKTILDLYGKGRKKYAILGNDIVARTEKIVAQVCTYLKILEMSQIN